MNVIIIEDREDTVKEIMEYCEKHGWGGERYTFGEYQDGLEKKPDVVILDWKNDDSGAFDGEEILNAIWDKNFCPIVIFSGVFATEYGGDIPHHPLIHSIQKGDELPVISYLESIEKLVPVISNLKDDFNKALKEALNALSLINDGDYSKDKLLKYLFAKRVVNYFSQGYEESLCDEYADKEKPDDSFLLPPWSQYIYPPFSKSLCTCDLIRKIPDSGDVNTIGLSEEYMLILTPSCDMVFRDGKAKVDKVLCAQCFSKEVFHGKTLVERPSKTNISEVKGMLNTGYNRHYVSLPEIKEVMPYLTVNMKDLNFVPLGKIAYNKEMITSGDYTHYRVVSFDSPYREQIVWAHMQISCRPGVPDRDAKCWAEGILTDDRN